NQLGLLSLERGPCCPGDSRQGRARMCPPYTETSLRSNPGYSSRNADNVFIFLLSCTMDFFCIPLTTDVSAPIRSRRFITYLLASSLHLASPPSPSSPSCLFTPSEGRA